MKRIFIHNPFFRILAPPVFGVFIYLLILLINNNVGQITTLVSNQEVYVSIGLSLISFESMRLVILLLQRFFSMEPKKLALQVFATTSISVAIVLIAISSYFQWVIGFDISSRELWIFGTLFTLTSFLYRYIVYTCRMQFSILFVGSLKIKIYRKSCFPRHHSLASKQRLQQYKGII